MFFKTIVGNPPYQAQKCIGNNNMPSIYHLFIDISAKIAIQTSLITPARFLFNIGGTPKAWNDQILHNTHFKVIRYESNSKSIFPNVIIKGGIAITELNHKLEFDEIDFYIPDQLMKTVLRKVKNVSQTQKTLADISSSTSQYVFTDKIRIDYPSIRIRSLQISSNINKKLNYVFTDTMHNNDIGIYMRDNNTRIIRYINEEYIKHTDFLDTFNVFIPKANGNGTFGEKWGLLVIGEPRTGTTDSFFSIGKFTTKKEATACMKYLKTKFVRSLTSLIRKTQNTSRSTLNFVPVQDFTQKSDIDWELVINDIDKQLYNKYGLSNEEINFIENNVQSMK